MNHGVVERLTRAAKDLQSLPSLAKAEDLKCLRARSNALRDLPELSPRARLLELTAAFNQIERLDLTAPRLPRSDLFEFGWQPLGSC